jgi:uncharacterized protein DUF2721
MVPDVSDLARAIQLALAPVFLLTGIGALLSVMTGRLARIIDRGGGERLASQCTLCSSRWSTFRRRTVGARARPIAKAAVRWGTPRKRYRTQR